MPSKLAAFKIHRRAATVAIFSGRTLDFVDVHHLSNVPKVATETLSRFIGWIVENFHPEIAALALDESGDESEGDRPLRTQILTEIVERNLLEHGIPVWKVADSQLLESYAIPSLTQKHDLREIAASMWPYLAKEHVPAVDAALIGLYVQVERLLSHN